MNKLQMTTSARSLLVKVFDGMSQSDKDRLGRDIAQKFDEIVTGETIREFKITCEDIVSIIKQGGYKTIWMK